MRKLLTVQTLLLILLWPSVAFADVTSDQQSFTEALVSVIVSIAFAVLTPMAVLLLRRAIKWFETKTNIDISDDTEKKLEEFARMGIHYAEEQAHKALKNGAPPMSGDEKKIQALEFMKSRLNDSRVAAVAGDALEKSLEAYLNTKRERREELARHEAEATPIPLITPKRKPKSKSKTGSKTRKTRKPKATSRAK